MPLQAPRLDDRSFTDLVDEIRGLITRYCPEWTDFNLSDPGITLVELFAWLTDIVLYRLNRVPEKHYIKFMELIGITLTEAEPARVPVTFWLTAPQAVEMMIPATTVVSTVRAEDTPAIMFTTDAESIIRIPKLIRVTTRRGGQRNFETAQNLSRLAGGFSEGFDVFPSKPPSNDDAIYFGFEEELSHHILGLDMDVSSAGGAGVDPYNPPYVWEVLSSDGDGWTTVEVDEDSTKSFNQNGVIRLLLPKMERGTRDNVQAYWLRCRLKPTDSTHNYQVSPRILRLSAASWGITIPCTNVLLEREELLGRSDGTPGQTFLLQHIPVMPRIPSEFLDVRTPHGNTVSTERWREVPDFASSNPTDHVFVLDSRTGELSFGPVLRQRNGEMQQYGAIPSKDSMVVFRQYRHGGGISGNVAARTLIVLKTSLPYIKRVANRIAASGGLDAEDLEHAKMRVPHYLRSLKRAVTSADFEYLTSVEFASEVGRVHCLQASSSPAGEVKLLIIPRVAQQLGFISPESLTLADDLQNRIKSYLDERRLLSTRLIVTVPRYQWVQTEVRFRPSEFADKENVRREVQSKLYMYLNPLTGGLDGTGWPLGRDLYASELLAMLATIKGIDFIRSVKLTPVNYDGTQFTASEPVDRITLDADAVIASYEHVVRTD